MRPLGVHVSDHLKYKDQDPDLGAKYERLDYVPNNPNYPDLLHSPYKAQDQYPRAVDYNMNIGQSICPLDMDPLSNILPFPATQAYKELGVFAKEKNPQDLADVLLSLKHAVVHPQLGGQLSQLGGQLSPLSPSYAMSAPAPAQQQYPVPHNYCSSQYGQFPDSASRNFAEFGPFPSMSVNVSMQMNMNMGLPANHHHQPINHGWNQQHAAQFAHSGPGAYSASYSNNQGYSASYSFSSDIRNLSSEREQRYNERSKYYTRRQKMSVQRLELTDSSSKMNLCRICGKTYARPSTLKTHMRTHSGEKPYRCTTCSKSFSQAANLTAHIRTHSGEKPFRCLICERRFSQSSSVTTHMRTHSGERPYRCRMCNKAFSDSSTLTKHLRIHSGEKPYKCELCLLRFSQSGNLNRHMRVHANNNS